MFYIHPDECINCGLCQTVCPVDAIMQDEDMSDDRHLFLAINRDFFGASVAGIGSPGGSENRSWNIDHPVVAAFPREATTLSSVSSTETIE